MERPGVFVEVLIPILYAGLVSLLGMLSLEFLQVGPDSPVDEIHSAPLSGPLSAVKKLFNPDCKKGTQGLPTRNTFHDPFRATSNQGFDSDSKEQCSQESVRL